MPKESLSEPSRRIVVLEADPGHRAAITEYLVKVGFQVSVFENLSVLRALREGPPAVCIVGSWIDDPGERPIIDAIRGLPRGKVLPIIHIGATTTVVKGDDQADFRLLRPFQNRQLVKLLKVFQVTGGWARTQPEQPLDDSVVQDPLSFPEQGQLAQTGFTRIFTDMWIAAASGSVILKSGNTIRRIDFVNGFPVFARSNLVTEHIIRFLLRLNVITPTVYRQLLSQAQAPDWNPQESLVGGGLISQDDFGEVQTALVREIVLQCFKWTPAAYRFSPEVITQSQVFTSDLNPFELYLAWLRELAAAEQFNTKVSHLLGSGLSSTSELVSNQHLLADLLSALPPRSVPFDGTTPVSSIIRESADDEEVKRILVTLVDFRQLLSVSVVKKERSATEPVALVPPNRKFERIRQMVAEDRARMKRAGTPYAVLGLSEGAASTEVNARYQRYRRFYKPENFERIGDATLLDIAETLLAAFRNAATEILGKAPMETTPPPTPRHPTIDSHVDQEEVILAEVFYDDGKTYLRVGNHKEAQEHFRRCTKLVPDNPKYLAMLGWVTYQAGQGNMLEVAKAKQTLLNALKIDPRSDRALYYLGCLYEDGRQLEKAIECWTKAVKIDSGNYEAQSALRRVKAR